MNDNSLSPVGLDIRLPKGLGWARARRDTGKGDGGMLDSTSWTAKGPVALGKLQENQST